MSGAQKLALPRIPVVGVLIASFTVALGLFPLDSSHAARTTSSDPWSASEVLEAADLARELADKNDPPPKVLYVGFHTLFLGGHIPGASFHGTASTAQGLAELKQWAGTLPRSTNLVIYCGCCPFDRCPNIRPAYTALHDLHFTKFRVLVLPINFATDWADKGYPIQKGS
jgi:thiosulfate/3-mercaptopyruvate sulfurtransferase